MKRLALLAFLFCLAAPAYPRGGGGGGGCFLPDTPILKADGTETAISAIKEGDELLSFTKTGKAVKARVLDIISVEAESYFELKTDKISVRATAEHPFYTGGGVFRTLEALKTGDTIYIYDGRGGLAPQTITAITLVREKTRVYNLHTDSPNTFFANYTAVHNKGGGCFAAGTLVDTPGGKTPIERLTAGDMVYAYEGGSLFRSAVKTVFVTASPVLSIKAGGRVLDTTAEHPLLTRKGFTEAGALRIGDEIAFLDGTAILWLKITALETSAEARPVYNLEVAPPHTFIAGGFIAHNKGGGGFRSSSRYGSSYGSRRNTTTGEMIFWLVLAAVVMYFKSRGESSSGGYDKPEVIIPERNITGKAAETGKLLEALAAADPAVSPASLKRTTATIFNKLQLCWTSRDYTPIKDMLTPYLYASHSAKLESMRCRSEINVMSDVQVHAVDLVFVNYAEKPEDRLFTALITASAADYYIDDRDSAFLRGDRTPQRFQEFWSFHFKGGNWLLAVVEQTSESEALSRQNVTGGEGGGFSGLDGFTAAAVTGASLPLGGGTPAGGAELSFDRGSAGSAPATPPSAEPVEPGPAFTLRPVPPGKNWSRTGAELAASLVFLNIYAAWEKGDAEALPKDDIFPEMLETIRSMIKKYRIDGLSFRFEDLAVSKAEPVLVNGPGSDGSVDEFVARICARARKTLLRHGAAVYQDPSATPFTEYWVFEKQGNRWKLKELLPRADGRKVLAGDDQETDSSPVQMEWHYRPGGAA